MFVEGQCVEGDCSAAKNSPIDCKDTPYCSLQLPHGMMEGRDYHPKVDEECVNIEERMGLREGDYHKIDLNRFCDSNKKRRDCLRPRFVAWPERLSFQLETDICQWNYNQEACRVNRVGAQYGMVVNTTRTTLRQEDPDYLIADARKPPKNRQFSKKGQMWANYEEYNEMCWGLHEDEHTLDGECEMRGCSLFFDERMYDVTKRELTGDAVYCVPRFPIDSKFGVDPNDLLQETPPVGVAREDQTKFYFENLSYEVVQEWIGFMLCDYVSPGYCNSIPGCNVKSDIGCKDNGATCYVCGGDPKVGGNRRLELGLDDTDAAGITEEEEERIWEMFHPDHKEKWLAVNGGFLAEEHEESVDPAGNTPVEVAELLHVDAAGNPTIGA